MILEDYIELPLQYARHGLSRHPLYPTWKTMMHKCYNPDHISYKHVGGQDIKVCKRWHDIRNFVKDLKTKPRGKVFVRLDESKDYSPDNYTWELRPTNRKRINYNIKLDPQTKQKIIELKQAKKSNKYIALTFNISSGTVSRVYSRYLAEQNKTKKLYRGEQSIADIKKLRQQGKKIIEIAAIYDLSFTHVQNILRDNVTK